MIRLEMYKSNLKLNKEEAMYFSFPRMFTRSYAWLSTIQL